MEKTPCISEHQLIPESWSPRTFNEVWQGGLCLNPERKNEFDRRYLFKWDNFSGEWCYRATYTIGAWWISGNQALAVTTDKFEEVDFLKMFSVCLNSDIKSDVFNRIYGLDVKAPSIHVRKMDSVISPLIVTHYVRVLKELVAKGLKKNYVYREDNLKRVRGKLLIMPNQHTNVTRKRLDRFYCRFQEFTEDIPENRLLKKAMLFAERIITRGAMANKLKSVKSSLAICKAAFANVDDRIDVYSVKHIKANKLFKEYDEAIRLAKIILRQYDFSITKAEQEQDSVMPFWIDMPVLYELYVYGMLKEAYGERIVYQKRSVTGVPDFLFVDKTFPVILDTKYKNMDDNDPAKDTDIVRQLSGYARDNGIRRCLGVDDSAIVPCVYIYPAEKSMGIDSFVGVELNQLLEKKENKIDRLLQFYKIGVEIPRISHKLS